MTTTTLPTIHLGSPTQVGPLTLFPVWTDAPVPAKPVALVPPKAASINELDTGPTVALLHVTNPTNNPFVLLEGLVVDGGWQHRVLIHDVLIGAGRDMEIGVRCVEQGRWGGGTTQRINRRRAPLAVSGALRGIGSERADQGEVWNRVEAYSQSLRAPSATSSMVEVLDQVDVSADLRALVPTPLAGQRGVLVGVDGHPAMLELFEHPKSFERQWASLIDGLLASTAHRPGAVTSGRRARAFVQRLSRRPLPYVDRAGDGFLAEAIDDLVSVRCLADIDGWGVHSSALNVRHRLVGSAV